jgi:3-methyladenine DNA glycosylase AlkC
MAEALKDSFGLDKPSIIAASLKKYFPMFDSEAFESECLISYEEKSLTERCSAIADAMHKYLPSDFEDACQIVTKSLGEKLRNEDDLGMAPFIYMPHVIYVGKYGLDNFASSMALQYELTQRFTAEFSIRAYLEQHPQETLAILEQWSADESPHVRRLVSEGTRPRLPWASRLKEFQKDPTPVIHLLEQLKDDEALYVRRSVANNLNDISKDNPTVVAEVTARWLSEPTPERVWVVKHALRSAIKRGERWALEVLGFSEKPTVSLLNVKISPSSVKKESSALIEFDVLNKKKGVASLLVDFQVHFVKANGKTSPKVFKLKAQEFSPGEQLSFRKKVSLKTMSTRKHYPGIHKVEAVINGEVFELGEFELTK